MKTLKLVCLLAVSALLTQGCIPDDGPGPRPNTELIGGWTAASYANNNIPFILSNQGGDKVSLIDSDLNSKADGVLLELEGKTSLVNFDENSGLPSRVTTSDGNIAIFRYKDDLTKLDIAYILKDETLEYARDIDIDAEMHQLALYNLDQTSKGNFDPDTLEAFLLGIQIATFSVNAALCFSSIAAAGTTFGATLPFAWANCSSAAFTLFSAYASVAQSDVDQQLADNVGTAGYFFDFLVCGTGDVTSCIDFANTSSREIWDAMKQIQVDQENLLDIGEGALISGFGEVKVTLTWNSTSDIDLWVIEPNANRIYFENPVSASGGVLDFDDVDGYGPENIFWKENAPIGNYSVQVHYYSDNGAGITDYTVQLEVKGSVRILRGTLVAEEQLNDVVNFSIDNSGKLENYTQQGKIETKVLKTTKSNQ